MKCQYIKRQIVEAIKHWESVLKKIDESEVSMHKALYSLFGDRLYDSNDRCSLTVQLVKDVFAVFNAELFDNKLHSLDPLVLDTNNIQELFNKYSHNEDPNNMYALYMPIPDWKSMEDNDMKTILNAEFFIVNSTTCKNASTSFIVNAICHEMIHQYDIWFGDILKIVLDAYRHKTMYNEHLTDIFQHKSQEANNMSLTIFPDGAGIPIDKLNSLSAMRLSRKKQLNEIDDIEQLEDEIIGPGRIKHFKSHMVATDLGDGRFAISF